MVQSVEEGQALVVLDVPLLFEGGLQAAVDAVLVVSAPAAVQRQRALQRPGMTEAKLDGILARQVRAHRTRLPPPSLFGLAGRSGRRGDLMLSVQAIDASATCP